MNRFIRRGNPERYARRQDYEYASMNIQSLAEKGSDPLRRGQNTNEINSPPKGQTPFRIGSQFAGEGLT